MNTQVIEEKIQNLKRKTNLDEAVITGVGKIDGSKAVIGVCDTRFLMGSMGEVVGEKLTRAVEKATEQKLPLLYLHAQAEPGCRRE